MTKLKLILIFLLSTPILRAQTLIMNEVSQGTSGSMEYVEFVVVDTALTYNCSATTPPSIDIRGWIFDDNSGYHGTGGIAGGAVRFSFNSVWAAVPLGTIILIYNDATPDPSIPPSDLNMNDGNCRIVAPISNTTLFESNLTTPGAVACSYPTTGWTPGGNWNYTLLANTGDCARIVNLAGCEVFSVCYGDVNLNTQIYFAAGAELVNDHRNTVYFFNGNDPLQQVNWSIGCTDNETVLDANQCGANFQTPGAPNNAANAAFIGQFNNNCQPILPMIASNTSTNVICNNGSNGSALISASGGIAPYQISWTGTTSGNPPGNEISVSGGTYNLTGLVAGTYNITVTGTHGCTATTTVTILAPTALAASNTSSNVTCNGGNNGSGVITATGGTAPYNVSWTGTTTVNPAGNEINTSGGTYTLSSLSAGTYNVTVTDANGCTSTTTVTISAPSALNVSNTATNVTCNGGNNGSSTLTATGGTAPYNVSWTGTTSGNPAGNEIAASGGTYTLTGLIAGTYNVTVTDANGCSTTTTVTISTPSALNVSNTATNITCNGGNNGSSTMTATGGTAPYNVSWTGTTTGNPTGNEIAASGGTYTLTGLIAGTYNVTVTDANGCSTTTTVTISTPSALNVSNTATNVTCNGGNNGSSTLTATGGTAPYNVSWTGTTSGNPAGNEIAASGGTYTLTGLIAGTYNVTVTDANGCSTTTTVTISTPSALNVSNIATNVTCNGGNNGSSTLTSTGGTAPYNVSWTGTTSGNPAGNEIAASGGTYTLTGLIAGTYNVTVTDANGCTATTAVTINQPTALLLSLGAISPQSCICNGSASVSVSGGVGPYNYTWYNAGNNSNINQPTPIASNLCSGSYYCVVTSANGCSDTISVFIPTTCSSYGTFASATMVENCDTLQFYNSTWGTLPDQINPLGILLNGFNYGSFFQNSGTLILRGGEVKTYKDAGANVCGAKLHYAVYPAANPPANPTFNILDLPFKESCNLGSSSFPTGGPCFFPGDQKWAKENYTIDLTNNAPGSYILDVFYAVPGSFTSTNVCDDTIYVNNNSLNYKALFTIEPQPSITPNGPTTFCEGGTVTLTSNYTSGNQWNTGAVLNAIDVNDSGTYSTEIDLDNNCPLASDSLIVNVLQLPELISLEGGGEFCEGEAINSIVATFSGSPNWTLTYNFNAGANQTINSSSTSVTLGNAEGVYILSGLTDNNCSNTLNDTIAILINPIPEAPIISGGGTYCFGTETPYLSAAGSTGNFTWYSDENLTQISGTGATITPTPHIGSSTYWITATASGCEGIPNLVTLTFLDCQITIPTAFTPNEDLTNDFWNIQDIDAYYPENQVFIYNRWGALLYQSEKGNYLTQPWNGKFKDENLPVGTYYYIIETGSETLKGIVSIILE